MQENAAGAVPGLAQSFNQPLKAVGESLRSNPRQSYGMEING